MKAAAYVLLFVTTMTLTWWAASVLMDRPKGGRRGPPITVPAQLDSIAVFLARDGDLEWMLRPYRIEPSSDEFTRRSLAAKWHPADGVPRAWRMLVAINHGNDELPWPPSTGWTLRVDERRDAVFGLDDGAAHFDGPMPLELVPLHAAFSQSGRQTIGPLEVVSWLVLVPLDLDFDHYRPELVGKDRRVAFEACRIYLPDLEEWERRPSGSLHSLVSGQKQMAHTETQTQGKRR